jgi:predicted RNase H-like HicB family nuclease
VTGSVYRVRAEWDPDAGVWVATSDDVPGLVTEAPTIEALTTKLKALIPDLLEANRLLDSGEQGSIAFELTSHRQENIALAS